VKLNKQEYLYEYNEKIKRAKIDGRAKGLLQFYANVFNWKSRGASFYTQRQICALVGMSQSTYQEKRDYLENLGWVKVEYRGRNKSCRVWVSVGRDDPEYEKKSWARWHPDNLQDDRLEESVEVKMDIPEFVPDDLKPLAVSNSSLTVPPWFWD
jgi:DNA-binding transcriptional MocR family regulator